jgi:ornithine cyclodeaminase/alanine dehydrogenase-like protein (mu-crystallin family)
MRCRARWPHSAGAREQAARVSGERTVFKAVGSALEDLAAATLVWQSTI